MLIASSTAPPAGLNEAVWLSDEPTSKTTLTLDCPPPSFLGSSKPVSSATSSARSAWEERTTRPITCGDGGGRGERSWEAGNSSYSSYNNSDDNSNSSGDNNETITVTKTVETTCNNTTCNNNNNTCNNSNNNNKCNNSNNNT